MSISLLLQQNTRTQRPGNTRDLAVGIMYKVGASKTLNLFWQLLLNV